MSRFFVFLFLINICLSNVYALNARLNFPNLKTLENSPALKSHLATNADPKIVTGAVLLNESKTVDAKLLIASLKKNWKVSADSVNITDKTIVFSVNNATVMLAWLDYAPPAPEVRAAARISWLWPGAEEEALRGKSQVVISVIGANNRALDLHKLFTKVAGAVLERPDANGVYMSDRYLLLSKGFYTAAARNLLNDSSLPVYCWVYFGMQQVNGTNGGYTYGLQEFGHKEMEISGSQNTIQDVHATLYDVAAFVVQWNYDLKNGSVFDGIPEVKIPISYSPAAFIDGETIKLGY
jgi:hypothetical protein